ncbi:hypothetical protein [Pseudomonas sp. Fl4BN1]|uniref:hypothetical protein n=1 Tax=Pseudomonas sp. Fl4BN1 TaxID=2697651 RepID=UPI00137653FD|nr:hypothetical protein [Pseudomonas sp. Fl4BN1]NBF09203.1 hypothetical protein [Pseudomonas sp. Fl4BN1]
MGALGVASLGIPGAKPGVVSVPKNSAAKEVSVSSDAKWNTSVSQADGDFGPLNQLVPISKPVFFDPKNSAAGFINNGIIKAADLDKLIPSGVLGGFKFSVVMVDGNKFKYNFGGQKVEIKWHSQDLNAAVKFPGSNSGAGWTAQIKIGNKLLGQDGNLYRKASNLTHIPVDF